MLMISKAPQAPFVSAPSTDLQSEWMDELIGLHKRQLPKSIICVFGDRGLKRYYRWLVTSQPERLIIQSVDGQLAGAAIMTFQPLSFGKRAILEALWAYSFAAPFHSTSWQKFLGRISPNSGHGTITGDLSLLKDPELPEFIQLFVSKKIQGKGLGRRLAQAIEGLARNAGSEYLLTRTEDVETNKAIGFHISNGFIPIGTQNEQGKDLIIFKKAHADLKYLEKV